MKHELDVVTKISAGFVAAYVAIAINYVARYDFGFSAQQIRGAALVLAVIIAALIGIDFFGKKLGKAK
jgi:hypothetical protein